MLFWNRSNQESAGRVYFNISTEKLTRSRARHAAHSTALVQTWMDQSESWNQSETILPQGSPELFNSVFYMRRKALGPDCNKLPLLRTYITDTSLGPDSTILLQFEISL